MWTSKIYFIFFALFWCIHARCLSTNSTNKTKKSIFLFCLCSGLCQTAYGVVRCITAEQNLAFYLHRTLFFRIFEFRKAASVCTIDVFQFVSFVAVGHTAKTVLPKLQSGHLKKISGATTNSTSSYGQWIFPSRPLGKSIVFALESIRFVIIHTVEKYFWVCYLIE